MAVTLDSLLAARDARRVRQESMLGRYPDLALIVLTVNIPGPEKRTSASVGIGKAGMEALKEVFGSRIVHEEMYDNETGFEAFLLVDADREEAKRLAVDIEEHHPLGRLMDIDVIGEGCVPLSRQAYGLPERRCMLCGDQARVCMRAGRHTVEELLEFINGKWDEYVRRS